MDLKQLKKDLKDAVKNKTLLTAKHDPINLGTTYPFYRTVLSHEASSSLETLINSEDYIVHEYENTKSNHNPYYMKIIPNSSSSFSIPASGITAHSVFASSILDSLIVVSGSSQGWHIFGENNSEIANKIKQNILIDKGKLL